MDSSVRKALKRFDCNKPILKCENCGMWKNIEKTDTFLYKRLGYFICINCGKIIRKK